MSVQESIENGQYSFKDLLRTIKFDLKQNILSCELAPSLQALSLASLVIHLWQCDIRDDINRLFHSNQVIRKYISVIDIYNMLEKKVLDKVSCLMIPFRLINVVERQIKIIRNEMENYFEYEQQFFLEYQKDINRFVYCWHNLCWTQEGKINKIKTAEKIIENSKISTKSKYILACNNCLVDKIPDLMKKLPESFIKRLFNNYVKNEFFIGGRSLVNVMFWTFYFKGEMKSFYEYFDKLYYGNLLHWAISNEEEVALQYIWENLVDKTVEHNLTNLIGWLSNISFQDNCLLYLFIQLNRPELKDLELSQSLAVTLYRISWYYNINVFSDYMLEISRTNNVWDTLEVFTCCWDESIRDLNTFVNVLTKIVLHFENDIRNNFDKICSKFLLRLLNKDLQMIKILLRLGTPEQKLKVLNTDCIYFCGDLICESVINFEQFIKDVFDSEEEISRFKSMLFANPRFDEIYRYLLIEKNFEDLDEILIRFCPMHKIKEFKNNLPHKNNASITLSIFWINGNDRILMILDKFLTWCCEDENKINMCKERIFNLEKTSNKTPNTKFFEILNDIKGNNKWELVEQYWKWIFFATENKIISPKEKLDRIEKILKFQSRKKYRKHLKRFITACFTADEIDELKEALKTSDSVLAVAKNMIRSQRVSKYSEDLVEWIFSYNKEAKEIFLENLKLKKGHSKFNK